MPAVVGGPPPFLLKLERPPNAPAEFKAAPGVPGTDRLGIGGREAIDADISAPALGPVGDSLRDTLALVALLGPLVPLLEALAVGPVD